MIPRLLDRQINLLDYLTSDSAIFGADGPAALDRAPPGFDTGLLRLEACFSHEKRMEKIAAVFPHTFRLLGNDQSEIARKFASVCPPIDNSRIENARQFYDFILREEQPNPCYLHDVAGCEFSFARARLEFKCCEMDEPPEDRASRGWVRRNRRVVLLNCQYDVREILETESESAVPVKRNTPLAILVPAGAQHPRVFEVLPPVFEVLAALDDWSPGSALPSSPELDALLRELAEHGLLEVRP
jgi:hypothetical protein